MSDADRLRQCNSSGAFAAFLKEPGDAPMREIIAKAVSLRANGDAMRIAAGLSQDEFDRIRSGQLEPEPDRRKEIIETWLAQKLFAQAAA
ncbi:MAG: hypothetical protein JWL87_244 [Candidatus Adlerbacteria bacterium]|nr:hypothetical protein [Candidatus Adlerbacteria bacterium]